MEFEVPAFDTAAAVFLAWAGSMTDVRLAYRPDPILGVDQPRRRGYLIDDIYFAVAWVAEGAPELARALDEAGIEAVSRDAERATHEELLGMVMSTGSPVPSTEDS